MDNEETMRSQSEGNLEIRKNNQILKNPERKSLILKEKESELITFKRENFEPFKCFNFYSNKKGFKAKHENNVKSKRREDLTKSQNITYKTNISSFENKSEVISTTSENPTILENSKNVSSRLKTSKKSTTSINLNQTIISNSINDNKEHNKKATKLSQKESKNLNIGINRLVDSKYFPAKKYFSKSKFK